MSALTGIQKTLLAFVFLAVLGGAYFFYSSRAGTEIALTLTTNPDLERGLVGHWTFDGSDFTDKVYDKSGNGNHGYVYGIATSSVKTLGTIGQGVTFTGTDGQYISMGDVNAIDGLSSITTVAWVKTTGTTDMHFVDKSACTGLSGTVELLMGYPFANRATFVTYWSSGGYDLVSSAVNINDNTWHHLVGVYDGSYLRIYVDGVESGSFGPTIKTLESTSHHLEIGGWCNGGSNEFDGSLDDVRIYNRALSADEVKRLYQLGATTKVAQTLTTNPTLETGLVGHWTFDGNDVDWGSTTAEIRDRSGNNNYANASGGMSATSSPTMGAIGQAIGCDGVSGWVNAGNDSDWQLHTTDSAIAFWMKSDTNHQDSEIIDRGAGGSGPGYLIAFSEPGYRLSSAFYADGGDHVSMGPYTVTPEQWYHVTVVTTLTPKEGKLYINGNLIQTDAYTGNLTDRSEVLSICSDEGGSGNFNGSIDDVRVYNRALSADEVKRLYQLGATTKIAETITSNTTLETGLVGHWTFDGSDFTDKVYDKSGNGNHGYVYGTATSGAKAMGVLGQAVQFDGVDDLIDLGSDSSLDDLYPATYSFWMYPMETANDFGGILTKTVWVIDRQDFDNSLESYNVCISNALYGKTPANSVQLNTWQHVTVTLDGTCSSLTTSVQIYINGVLQALTGSTGVTLSADGSYPLQIGKNLLSDPDGFFKGSLDDVRVYNRILSAEEVKRLYQLGK